ncbi:NADH:flavin oxidoreductase/NADH oxidase [Paraburkholderia tropica]
MEGEHLNVLATPIVINGTVVKNRLVMGPMAVAAPTKDGRPSDQTIAFFRRRAEGGVGMIIAGGIVATKRSFDEAPFKPLLRFDVDEFLPDFQRVADVVHDYHVPIIAEIMPGFGRMGVPGPGRPIISASPINVTIPEAHFPKGLLVPGGRSTPVPSEASIEEIELAEQEMIDAAVRVQRAGWDGVEVAAHMSYFAASFLSPRTNWRTARYGGSIENRARMLVNIVSGIRARVGRGFVIGLRMTANDYMQPSTSIIEAVAIAKLVERAGAGYVALTAGCYETMDRSTPSEDGQLIDTGEAKAFKTDLSVPVLVQGLHDPNRAERAVVDGHADMVVLARQLLADPDYPRKVFEGRGEDVVRCDRENQCVRRLIFNMPVRCTVNREMGREDRNGSKLPPVIRLIQAPLERTVLSLTGSRGVMKVVGALSKERR